MRIAVLAGGVGGARFVRGLRAAAPDAEITVIVNTGDDLWLTGVRLQPDIDSILYALAGVNDTERGWGRAEESERVSAELHAWGAGWPWFTLGDLDLGTHLARTGWLRDGATPTEVVERLSARWPLGVRLLPMTDTEVDTQVVFADGDRMHFQQWWVQYRASRPAAAFENPGIEQAVPAPGVIETITAADVVVIAPSNPVVSIGPILAVPGIRAALGHARRVVGISPIIGGKVVRGMADACLAAIGVDTAADAVARHYGRRADGGLLDVWLLAEEDEALAAGLRTEGWDIRVEPLWMTDTATSSALARAAIDRGQAPPAHDQGVIRPRGTPFG